LFIVREMLEKKLLITQGEFTLGDALTAKQTKLG